MTNPIRIGTRGSPLALWQARTVAGLIEQQGRAVEIVTIKTQGDRIQDRPLSETGGKNLFVKEIEDVLLAGSVDVAVHSAKDMSVAVPDGLGIAAVLPREDPRDALVCRGGLSQLSPDAAIGTGSIRRITQMKMRMPHARFKPLRGNVDTRLRKWRDTKAGGVILAGAGLHRLALLHLPVYPVPPEVMLPAPGQGTLALQVRAGGMAAPLCQVLDDPDTARSAEAERRVVAAFGGDCSLPLGAWARPDGGNGHLRLTALLATPDGRHFARAEAVGATPQEAADACVAAMRENGADEVLERIRG